MTTVRCFIKKKFTDKWHTANFNKIWKIHLLYSVFLIKTTFASNCFFCCDLKL